jgi:glycosyltransferase involved in cell wall biosynthesis
MVNGGDRVPPTLLVDCRGLHLSGIGRYLREVLLRLFRDERFGRFHLLGEPGEVEAFASAAGAGDRVEVLPIAGRFYAPGVHARMALLAARGALRADAAFFPHYDVPPLSPLPPLVVTVHDLSHFVLRDVFPAHKRAPAWLLLRRAVARARSVVVVSEATRADLLARLPWAADRVHVVPQGVDRAFFTDEDEAIARRRAAEPYILCVGNRKPHKNLQVAVEVLRLLHPRHPGLRLVLAGDPMAPDDPLRRRAAEAGVAHLVDDVGAPTDAELRALYAGAACFLFPSLYEGFGLPVLEAMAAGAPVVAADRASIPEVAGDAALLADPTAPADLAAAVERLLLDEDLRAGLVARGRQRAARFTWELTAAATAAHLRAAAGADAPQRRFPAAAAR